MTSKKKAVIYAKRSGKRIVLMWKGQDIKFGTSADGFSKLNLSADDAESLMHLVLCAVCDR